MSWRTFRELDQVLAQPKGTAFRGFKALEPQLQEGRDFRLLQAGRDDAEIGHLRAEQRIYQSSVNVVLLSDATATRILRWLDTNYGTP